MIVTQWLCPHLEERRRPNISQFVSLVDLIFAFHNANTYIFYRCRLLQTFWSSRTRSEFESARTKTLIVSPKMSGPLCLPPLGMRVSWCLANLHRHRHTDNFGARGFVISLVISTTPDFRRFLILMSTTPVIHQPLQVSSLTPSIIFRHCSVNLLSHFSAALMSHHRVISASTAANTPRKPFWAVRNPTFRIDFGRSEIRSENVTFRCSWNVWP